MLLILALALLLRSSGLGRDFPFAAHCDVPKQVSLISAQLEQNGLVCFETGYPLGHQQLASYGLLTLTALADWMHLPLTLNDQDALAAARINVLFLSVLSVLLAILSGRLLFGAGAGLVAGLILATDGFFLAHTHWAMGDVPQASLTVAALYFCLRIQKYNRLSDSLLAGLAVGMAAAVKYYGGYMLGAVILAHLLADRKNWWGIVVGLLGTGLGFAALTPLLWQDPARWYTLTLGELMAQGAKGTTSYWDGLANSIGQWLRYSPATVVLVVPGVVLLLWRHARRDWVLLFSLLTAGVLIQGLRVNHLKEIDQVIQAAFFALAAAGGLAIAWRLLAGLGRHWPGRRAPLFAARAGLVVLAVALILWQGFLAARSSYLLYLPDTRKQLQVWLEENLPSAEPGDFILVDETIASATDLQSTTHYYPEHLGYSSHPYSSRDPKDAVRDMLANRDKASLIITHRMAGQPRLDAWEEQQPPVQVFELMPSSWHNPTILVYDPDNSHLGQPLRQMGLPVMPWPDLVQAATPYSLRKVRQRVLDQGRHRFIVQSPEPLPMLAVAVTGGGKVVADQGGREQEVYALPDKPRLMRFTPANGFPWRPHTYRLTIEVSDGPVLTELILAPSELAWAYYRAGERQMAAALWEKELAAGEPVLPLDRLTLAAFLEKHGQKERALELRQGVFREYPGLDSLLRRAAGGQGEHLTAADLSKALGLPPRSVGWRGLYLPASRLETDQTRIPDACRCGRGGLLIPAGSEGWSKFWLDGYTGQKRIKVRFLLEGSHLPPGGASCLVDVFGHFGNKPLKVLAEKRVALTGEPQTVSLDLELPLVPMGLEFRLWQSGQADICFKGVELFPDVLAPVRRLAGAAPDSGG